MTFKTIPGFPDYEASDRGMIRNKHTGRIRKLYPNRHHGYLQCALSRNGKSYNKEVHVIIARTFLGPRPKGKEINHIDGIKTHNQASNLKYTSRSENMKHAHRLGLMSRRLRPQEVWVIKKLITEKCHSGILHKYFRSVLILSNPLNETKLGNMYVI
ncbi:MAG: hypothetical protein DRJ03_01050 [Chloroflexi bacterium]|nr:MAG: hypothetical protein DRJ03_01050 [Chloroflexota bacterium]